MDRGRKPLPCNHPPLLPTCILLLLPTVPPPSLFSHRFPLPRSPPAPSPSHPPFATSLAAAFLALDPPSCCPVSLAKRRSPATPPCWALGARPFPTRSSARCSTVCAGPKVSGQGGAANWANSGVWERGRKRLLTFLCRSEGLEQIAKNSKMND